MEMTVASWPQAQTHLEAETAAASFPQQVHANPKQCSLYAHGMTELKVETQRPISSLHTKAQLLLQNEGCTDLIPEGLNLTVPCDLCLQHWPIEFVELKAERQGAHQQAFNTHPGSRLKLL